MFNALRRGLVAGITVAALVFGLGIFPTALALAQANTVTEAPGQVSLVPLVNTFLPYAVELFMAGIFALGGIAVAFMKQKFNVDMTAQAKVIESKYRDSLHSAVYTGVAGVIARGGLTDHLTISVGSEELASILRHVRNSVPDALEFFQPSEAVIAKLATAKAVELAAVTNTPSDSPVTIARPAVP